MLRIDYGLTRFSKSWRPTANPKQILIRYGLRVLKQGNKEEFVTKAKQLVEEAGYPEQEEMMRDTLVFGIEYDQVCRDAIKIGDTLTYEQIYNLAKIDESTRTQAEVLSINPRDKTRINKVKRRLGQIATTRTPKYDPNPDKNRSSKQPNLPEAKGKKCYGCRSNHQCRNQCPARSAECRYYREVGNYMQVCIKKIKTATSQSPRPGRIPDIQAFLRWR